MAEPLVWRNVSVQNLQALVESRLLVHWASQVVPAVAQEVLEPRADDSHTGGIWMTEHDALVGQALPTRGGARVGLRLPSFDLVIVRGDAIDGQFTLRGQTLEAALDWTARTLELGGLTLPSYDMPDHPVSSGSPFPSPEADALGQLGLWLENGFAALSGLAAVEGADDVVCWPHHFDVGGLALLDPPVEKARQIGFGLSLGDGFYAEPYFYVTPFPLDEGVALPPLGGGGHWHREGFIGAVLPASSLGTDGQAEQVREYLASALTASHNLLSPS